MERAGKFWLQGRLFRLLVRGMRPRKDNEVLLGVHPVRYAAHSSDTMDIVGNVEVERSTKEPDPGIYALHAAYAPE